MDIGFTEKLPLINSKSKVLRLVGYCFYGIIGLFVLLMILGILIGGPSNTTNSANKTTTSTSQANSDIKSFKSDIGTVEIYLPYDVELQSSSGSTLNLQKVGTTKPIISIIMYDVALYETFQDFAESFMGEGYDFEKMLTDDGKPMLFYANQDGVDTDGNPTYKFRGCIDYSQEFGKYIIIHAPNKVRYQGRTIATYTENEFIRICQSFRVKS